MTKEIPNEHPKDYADGDGEFIGLDEFLNQAYKELPWHDKVRYWLGNHPVTAIVVSFILGAMIF